jgi:hypothetical protein
MMRNKDVKRGKMTAKPLKSLKREVNYLVTLSIY